MYSRSAEDVGIRGEAADRYNQSGAVTQYLGLIEGVGSGPNASPRLSLVGESRGAAANTSIGIHLKPASIVYSTGASGEQSQDNGANQTNTQTANISRIWEVGLYEDLKSVETGLDAHHIGQKALMARFIPGYDFMKAPTILVPKEGHTVRSAAGVVSRAMGGFTNARQVLARDLLEMRRVYPNVPNNSLLELMELNKTMYPNAFIK